MCDTIKNFCNIFNKKKHLRKRIKIDSNLVAFKKTVPQLIIIINYGIWENMIEKALII